MPDIGLGEVALIAVLALLVFGPDRLPKVAADAGRLLRQVRDMATRARTDLIDAAGLQEDGEVRSAVSELDPRQVMRLTPGASSRPTSPATPGATPRPTSAATSPPRPSQQPQGSDGSGAISSDGTARAATAGDVADWT